RDIYGLSGIPNIVRGTLRHKGFCDAWAALVKIGMTDSSFPIFDSAKLSYHELMEAYVPAGTGSVKERLAALIREEPNSPVMEKLEWLGLFKKSKIKVANATPALILEQLLLDKWKLHPNDKDMVIMQHEIEYELAGRKRRHTSTMVMKGENESDTAMARLVGLPLGIFVKLVMESKINARGVQIPVMREVYEPVLKELEEYGVVFKDKDEAI
ncbi:MAG: saccharopine dehydrogenase C-terminal domain-containing protein, partial [Saprospiraceae bacterium]